jgi:hypothetical protein
MFTQEVLSLRNDQFHNLLGTIELDVQPIKKEVEKVRDVIIASTSNDGEKMISAMWIPGGAYDVKVSYKIKE